MCFDMHICVCIYLFVRVSHARMMPHICRGGSGATGTLLLHSLSLQIFNWLYSHAYFMCIVPLFPLSLPLTLLLHEYLDSVIISPYLLLHTGGAVHTIISCIRLVPQRTYIYRVKLFLMLFRSLHYSPVHTHTHIHSCIWTYINI